jgi:hypothetical protein
VALSQHTLSIQTKAGRVRSYGRSTWDSTQPAATLVGVYVQSPSENPTKQEGTSARARIDAGVVTVDVEGPLAAGVVPVVVTINA